MVMDQISDEKNTDENWLTEVSLAQGISTLSLREQEIVKLRFYEGKTQVEVSREMGISQAQVSRLEKSAINGLRKCVVP